MMQALTKGPKIVERILRVFPTDRLDEKITKDRFSAREIVAHLADYEQYALDVIRVANQKPGHTFELFDNKVHAQEHHYADKEVFHEAEVFETRRQMTLDYALELKNSDEAKTINLGGKEICIHTFLMDVINHDLDLIDQLTTYLATEVATHS